MQLEHHMLRTTLASQPDRRSWAGAAMTPKQYTAPKVQLLSICCV